MFCRPHGYINYLFLVAFSLTITACSDSNEKLKIPAKYNPDSGTYTINTLVGANKTNTDIILDTGSANLILVGNKQLCPNCTMIGTNTTYTPSPLALTSQSKHQASYGSTAGKYHVYADTISISEKQQAPYIFSVFTEGEHLSNIWGLAYQRIAYPKEQPLQTYFDFVVEKDSMPNIFSLLYCADKGDSYFFIGSPKVSNTETTKEVPVINHSFYIVLLKQIGLGKDKDLITFEDDYDHQATVIDSGLGGLIALPKPTTEKIINYLYKNTNDKNRALPDNFWHKNYCVTKSAIDYKAFPDLSFNFINPKKPKELIPLTITPEQYINMGGCGAGRARLSFIPTPVIPAHSKLSKHKKNLLDIIPNKILGTPLLENYLVTFDREKPAKIIFSDNSLCKKEAKLKE